MLSEVNEAAITPVLRDLRESGRIVIVAVEEEHWGTAPPAIVLRGFDGSVSAFTLDPDATADEQIVDAADHVQDLVIDLLHGAGEPAEWPACPTHPGVHPLTARVDGGSSRWCCPTDRGTRRQIGDLGLAERRSTPPGRDEPVDPELADALAPVLRDLRATGGPTPTIGDGQWDPGGLQATAMLWRSDGTAAGVGVPLNATPAERVVAAADAVQGWAVDGLWRTGSPTNWPQCPAHPDAHPMQAVVDRGVPSWACPATGASVAVIGSLDPTPQP